MAVGCAGAALVAAGCGLTNASSKTTTQTVTVTRTVTHTVTTTSTSPSSSSAACAASQLSGTFAVEPGSAGAGNIIYKLQVTNTSQSACTVTGVPTVDFLDAAGQTMPSKTSTSSGTIATVTLQPGTAATSEVRFSPDVTPCDPGTATTLRVTLPDSSTLEAKLDPPTRLCGAGSLQPAPFTRAA